MKTIMRIIDSKAKIKRMDDELKILINDFIEGFIAIGNNIKNNDKNFESLNEQMSEYLVLLVESINKDDINTAFNLIKTKLYRTFKQWKKVIEKKIKYKLYIYGTSQYAKLLNVLIDFTICEIIGAIQYKEMFDYKSLNNIKTVGINSIEDNDYDYIIVLSSDNLEELLEENNIYREKLFRFDDHFHNMLSYNLYSRVYPFLDVNTEIEGLITGISYASKGIDANCLRKKMYNFAMSSQDLYYDLKMFKYAMEFDKVKDNIKYAIIGLCYYSFQYDLSMARETRELAKGYYTLLNDIHNYDIRYECDFELYKNIANSIFIKDYERVAFNIIKPIYDQLYYKSYHSKYNKNSLLEVDKNIIINDIKRKTTKNYPLTVKENKEIFREYLEILKEKNIKPIIVICPVTDIYIQNIDSKIIAEFYSIINEFKLEYKFQLMDYFNSNSFIDEDFHDYCHLNNEGAKKFTQLLDNLIEW